MTSSVSNKRVPLPVRIIAGIIVIRLFGGAAFLIIYAGIVCFNSTEFNGSGKIFSIIILIFSAIFIGMMVKQIVTFFKSK